MAAAPVPVPSGGAISFLDDYKTPALKKILRDSGVPPQEVLAAKTRLELLEIADSYGIKDAPDQWGMSPTTKAQMGQKMSKSSDAAVSGNPHLLSSGASKREVTQEAPTKSTGGHGSHSVAATHATASSSQSRGGTSPSKASPPTNGGVTGTREQVAGSRASRASAQRLQRAQERSARNAAEKQQRAGGGSSRVGGRAADQPKRSPTHRTPDELIASGFPSEKVASLFSCRQPPDDAQISLSELKEAEVSAELLRRAGFPLKALASVGFTTDELATVLVRADNLKELQALGFTTSHLYTAGFEPQQLRGVGFSPAQLLAGGASLPDLKTAGFAPAALKDAGYGPAELLKAGYTRPQVREAGFTARVLRKKNNWSGEMVREAGFTAAECREQLDATADELREMGYGEAAIRAAGYAAVDKPTQAEPSESEANTSEALPAEMPTAAEGANGSPARVPPIKPPGAKPAPPAAGPMAALAHLLDTGLVELAKLPAGERGCSFLINDVGELLRETVRAPDGPRTAVDRPLMSPGRLSMSPGRLPRASTLWPPPDPLHTDPLHTDRGGPPRRRFSSQRRSTPVGCSSAIEIRRH